MYSTFWSGVRLLGLRPQRRHLRGARIQRERALSSRYGGGKQARRTLTDFSAASPILFVDLHLNFQGDITTALSPWTPGVNRAYVTVGFPVAFQDKFYNSPDYDRLVQNVDA